MRVVNYAHRGYSEGYPENTLYSFYMGLDAGADGIETDIRSTKDGVLVLFHDNTLERILGIPGAISDYTYSDLSQMDFGAFKGEKFRNEKLVSLEEFLFHFGDKSVTFALELKQEGIEKTLLEMLARFHVKDNVIITSFDWNSLLKIRSADSQIRIGYLTERVDDRLLEEMLANHFQQICPKIDYFDEESYRKWTTKGISIRYWGITGREKIRKALAIGCDGMTVNNPALLRAELGN